MNIRASIFASSFPICVISITSASCHPTGASNPRPQAASRLHLPGQPNEQPKPVELSPVHIDARSGHVVVPRDLFDRGLHLLARRKYGQAARLFAQIPRLFPKWAGRWSASYNQAVALEQAGRFRAAAKHYDRVRTNSQDPDERMDATIRLALCLSKSGAQQRGLDILRPILDGEQGDDRHFLDAACAAAEIHIHRKEFDEADRVLERALDLEELSSAPKRLESRAARCALWYGKSAEARMKAVALRLPLDRLERALLQKSDLFTKARTRYFQVLKYGRAGWSALALERLAAMFEEYFWAVIRAPLPPFGPVLYYDGKRKKWRTLPAALVRKRYETRLKRNLRSAMRLAIRVYERQLDELAAAGWSSAVLAPARHKMARLARLADRIRDIPIGPQKPKRPIDEPTPSHSRPRSSQTMSCPFRPIPTGLK